MEFSRTDDDWNAGNGGYRTLIVEPFYGGSHQQLIDLLMLNVPHCIKYTLPAKKWHWKARTSALHFAQVIPRSRSYKVLFTSSVLNLAELVALRTDLASLHKVLYFHENQLVYPIRKQQERDFQYGYNQILSCLAADSILFNSRYNMESFLSAMDPFLGLIPIPGYRSKGLHRLIRPKCRVLYFPLRLPDLGSLSGGNAGGCRPGPHQDEILRSDLKEDKLQQQTSSVKESERRSFQRGVDSSKENPGGSCSPLDCISHQDKILGGDLREGIPRQETSSVKESETRSFQGGADSFKETSASCSPSNCTSHQDKILGGDLRKDIPWQETSVKESETGPFQGCAGSFEETVRGPCSLDCMFEETQSDRNGSDADADKESRNECACDQKAPDGSCDMSHDSRCHMTATSRSKKPLHILWPHRWEHDKNPELFFHSLVKLHDMGLKFHVSVLGEQFTDLPDIFCEVKSKLQDHIVNWGYLPDKDDYYRVLFAADVAVSTADHEFFGVAMLEAVHLRCYPLCPNRLVYPEIFPKDYLYSTSQQLLKKLREFCRHPHLVRNHNLQVDVKPYSWEALQQDYLSVLMSPNPNEPLVTASYLTTEKEGDGPHLPV